jgi:GTP pyrophosphokinase
MLKLDDITDSILQYHPNADIDIILNAYVFTAKAHRGQSRKSGEAYLSHPLEVAYNVTRLKMDEVSVAAALLHDTIEDTMTTAQEILDAFGEEVYQLVDGLTKISQIEFASKEEKQAENFRKMILAMSKDIRVILIKLADRAHNIKTLGSMQEASQKRIARETLEIFAPLAHRLGIGWVKAELENEAFKYIDPKNFKLIDEKLELKQEQREKLVDRVCEIISSELESAEVQGRIMGRPKNIFSIFSKMEGQNLDFEEIYDLIGVRILTSSIKDCYAVLGMIHSIWKPIPGKFKDYIAMPKPNMYRSLHTTVIGPDGQRVEIQIRTEEMHLISEEGIAAHWHYKENAGRKLKEMDEQLLWVRHFLEENEGIKNPKEFLSEFKVNLYPYEVYVFTPKGEVVALPQGSTAIDFAFHVHTDVGSHCMGSKVNGRIVPLRYKLRNGDHVEVFTSVHKEPTRDWLQFVRTSRARGKILNYLNGKEKSRNLEMGKEKLNAELKNYDLNLDKIASIKGLDAAVHACGFNSLDTLIIGVGFGEINPRFFAEKIVPRERLDDKKEEDKQKVKDTKTIKKSKSGIWVKGFDSSEALLIRMGKCCNPVPGDVILGYITRGRGISVHTGDCPSVSSLKGESDRILEVGWHDASVNSSIVHIQIVTNDKTGMLATISIVFAELKINITRASVNQGPNKRAYFDFSIEVSDLDNLNKALSQVKKVEGVLYVERIKEHQRKSSKKKFKKLDSIENGSGNQPSNCS